jgi:hypothetical protein
MPKAFKAEQVDALALAIDNIEKGAGFIIGDQTGIGKGRVNAGVIRYAMNNGLVPIFVTEGPNLYGDMYRDLKDIGFQKDYGRDPNILMTNPATAVPLDERALDWMLEAEEAETNGTKAPKREGLFLKSQGPGAKHNAMLDEFTRNGVIGEHDMVFTTYHQMQTVKGERPGGRRS